MNQDTQRLSIVLETYISKRQRLKWSTVSWKRQAWKRLIEAIGDMPIGELRPADMETFENYLYNLSLSPNSIRSYLTAVGPVLDWAMRREYLATNPAAGYKLPRAVDGDVHVFTASQLADLLSAARDLRWRAMITAAATAGLRKSEVLNLTVTDVDFDGRKILVQQHKETANTWSWTPKSSQRRIVPLADPLSTMLCELLADEVPNGQPYLFLDEKRYWFLRRHLQAGTLTDRWRLWPDENFGNAFRRLRRRAGIEQGTFHDLRRTCLTYWSRYLPPQEVQKLAGHADIETTMRYYLGVRADVLDLAKTLNLCNRGDPI